jgi:hypothetical protein
LKETISSSELVKTGSEITEISIDSVLKEGVLKEFAKMSCRSIHQRCKYVIGQLLLFGF